MEAKPYVQRLQEDVLKHQSLLDECMATETVDTRNKSNALQTIEQLNTKCCLYSIQEGYLRELASAVAMRKKRPGKPFICGNSKEHTGSAMVPLMRLLSHVRENPKVFAFLAGLVNAAHKHDEAVLNLLAADMVRNLFESFVSVEETVMGTLKHIEELLGELRTELIGKSSVFEGNGILDNLINAFINRSENKEYLVFLFKPILEDISQKVINFELLNDLEESREPDKDDSAKSARELIEYCDQIIESITTKLNAMPLGMRHLMKSLAKAVPSTHT